MTSGTMRAAARRAGRPAGALLLLLGCAPAGDLEEGCRIAQPSSALPSGLAETSGAALSRAHAGVLWTHNDSGGDAEVVGVGLDGQPTVRVRLAGVEPVDWEDLALGPCPAGSCLYIADTGSGGERRGDLAVYRIPEPGAGTETDASAERFPMRYEGGSRDTEAMFVLPSGEIFLITKGHVDAIELFRYPPPLRPDEVVTLESVRTLAAEAQPLGSQVTGASASPSGEWVAVRSYKRLNLWRTPDLIGGAGEPAVTIDLSPLGEVQGEAVALLDNGAVVLTSEGGFPGAAGTFAVLRCPLE